MLQGLLETLSAEVMACRNSMMYTEDHGIQWSSGHSKENVSGLHDNEQGICCTTMLMSLCALNEQLAV